MPLWRHRIVSRTRLLRILKPSTFDPADHLVCRADLTAGHRKYESPYLLIEPNAILIRFLTITSSW